MALVRRLTDYRDPLPSSQPDTTYWSASVPEAPRDNLSVCPGALILQKKYLEANYIFSWQNLTSKRAILINLIQEILKGNMQYLKVLLLDAKLHLDTDLKRKKNIIENFAAEICKDSSVKFFMQMTFLSFPQGSHVQWDGF